MTKPPDPALAKVHDLAEAAADASGFSIDPKTRAAICEGLAQAARGEFVDDRIVAGADRRHRI
jgi:hypothetical protein